jgi:multidrug efflux pump
MSLSSLSIRRPVLAIVMSITIVLFGAISFFSLGVREYPAVEPPIITVSTSYPGANAAVIESQITEPIETSVNAVDGIRTLTSISREGRSTITVEFDVGVDMERAANDVRDRVSRSIGRLPPDVDPPVVSKADADAMPIAFLAVRSDSRDLLDLTRIAEDIFRDRLQTINGVASVDIWGSRRYAMRIWLDPQRLAAYGLTPLDVRSAIGRENVELPSGRIEGQSVELTVRTMGRLQSAHDFNDLILKEEGGSVVRLADVGRAELGPENDRTILKRDGVPMVGVVIRPQPGANYIAIMDGFYERIAQIERDLPADLSLAMGFDTSQFIRKSVREVQQTVLLAIMLVILVIFLFLRDWRTTLIPFLVIPVALIGSFFVMLLAGFTINVLTLLAIVLAIGLVVDDAIVVLENIYAKIEKGMPPIQAGVEGSKEIFFAVIATSLSLVAVFMPILFMGGLTGRLFREFGVVLAGAVLISSFVALTLTPMVSTRLLRKGQKHSRFYYATEPVFEWLNAAYARSLARMMRRRWLVFPVIGACLGLSVLFMNVLQAELAPLEDRSNITMNASAPEGVTFEFMDGFIDQLVEMVRREVPEAAAIVSVTSPGFGGAGAVNSGFLRILLVEPSERERTQFEIADHLSRISREYTGARTFVSQQQSIGDRRGGLPVQYVIQAPNFERLREALPAFMDEAMQEETFSFVDTNLRFNKPELRVDINRERARALGVSVMDVAQTLQLSLSESRVGFYVMDGKQYQVIGQLERENRAQTLDLRSLFVRNNRGELVQLDNVVTVSEESAPPQLFRFNRFVSATVSAALLPGKTIGDGIEAMDRVAARTLDDSFQTSLSGPSRDFAESATSLAYIFLLALLLVYLVLAAQFESFRDPLVIMFTVPLALAGALLFLWYFNQTLNVFSQIGMIMLIGLVTKNGILIVEFANQRKLAGLSVREAALDAASARFRPVLMTSLSTILGILPIALALGEGAQSRVPMGIAVIGGLTIGSLLTLYVIPSMYSYLTKKTANYQAEDLAPAEPSAEAVEDAEAVPA